MFLIKTVFSFVVVGFFTFSIGTARAGLVLTYDSPTLQLAPGQSIQIGATLTNTSGSGVFTTDGNGVQTFAPFFESTFTVGEQYQVPILIFGQPDPYLVHYSHFVVNAQNPMADLNIADGSSSHLVLGTLTIDPATPAGFFTGSYGVDIGIYEAQSFPCSGVCTTLFNPFAPPTIDAGILSVNVASIPEPSTLALIGLGGGVMGGWRCRSRWRYVTSRPQRG